MTSYLVASELGLVLLDEAKKPISKLEFASAERAKNFLETNAGTISESQLNWLKENVREDAPLYAEAQIAQALRASFANAQPIS